MYEQVTAHVGGIDALESRHSGHAGTDLGADKAACLSPTSTNSWISCSFVSVEMSDISICRPSPGPTSCTLTADGSGWIGLKKAPTP